MWSNVHRIFAQEHVTNVVWVMDYMAYSRWECLWQDMWPGNDLVDWVAYDTYSDGRRSWDDTIGQFYGWLNTHSDTAHAFRSKPYMVGEFGVHGTNQQFVYQWYEDGKKALDRRAFPNLRAYIVFDSCGNGYDSRTGYVGSTTIDTCTTMPDPTEQEHFNTLIKDPALRPVVRN
jgi:beta-mannanase